MALIGYDQYLVESDNKRTWLINQIENTDKAHSDIKKEFLRKFPGQSKLFDKIVSEIVD